MGEFADMAIDQAWDTYDEQFWDEDGHEYGPRMDRVCRKCGAGSLHWEREYSPDWKQKRWVLCNSYGTTHACFANRPWPKPLEWGSPVEEAKHRRFDGRTVFEYLDMLQKEADNAPANDEKLATEGRDLIRLIRKLCDYAMEHDPKRMCDPPAGWSRR